MTEPTEAHIKEACKKANALIRAIVPPNVLTTISVDPATSYVDDAFVRLVIEHEAAMQRVSEIAKAALALGHKDDCTSPYGYPERCSCGFGALVKPFQEFIQPDPTPTPEQVLAEDIARFLAITPTEGNMNGLVELIARFQRGRPVAPIKDTRHD